MSDGIIRIVNISNYIQEIVNGDLILTPKTIYITETELYQKTLYNSKILECKISDVSILKLKYNSILIHIYKQMPTNTILQNTTFNFKLEKINGINGYHWHKEINMSMQNKDANLTFKEIIKMIKLNKLSFDIKIKLFNGEIINFKLK